MDNLLFFFSSSSSCSNTGPPEVLQPEGLLYEAGFGSSRLYRQESPRLRRERPLAGKGGTMGEKCTVNFAVKKRVPRYLKGSITCRKSATWDRRLYSEACVRCGQLGWWFRRLEPGVKALSRSDALVHSQEKNTDVLILSRNGYNSLCSSITDPSRCTEQKGNKVQVCPRIHG
jgi:hypothetical protein